MSVTSAHSRVSTKRQLSTQSDGADSVVIVGNGKVIRVVCLTYNRIISAT